MVGRSAGLFSGQTCDRDQRRRLRLLSRLPVAGEFIQSGAWCSGYGRQQLGTVPNDKRGCLRGLPLCVFRSALVTALLSIERISPRPGRSVRITLAVPSCTVCTVYVCVCVCVCLSV